MVSDWLQKKKDRKNWFIKDLRMTPEAEVQRILSHIPEGYIRLHYNNYVMDFPKDIPMQYVKDLLTKGGLALFPELIIFQFKVCDDRMIDYSELEPWAARARADEDEVKALTTEHWDY